MPVSKDVCPVPFDQQPLNEFYALKNSCFFSFPGFKFSTYVYRVGSMFLTSILLFAPLILVTIRFSWDVFVFNESICSIMFLSLILIRLYLGWSYILDRLLSATVFYEESGWYDGQIWIKTPEILTKDRLIGTYYVAPLLQRIKFTLWILSLSSMTEIAFYCLIC